MSAPSFRTLCRRTLWGALCCLFCVNSLAAVESKPGARLVGSPPVERFVPDIDLYPQNFTVVQDARGVVYIGNAGGVVEYDGERWRLIALPNAEIVRALAVAGDGTVYVGSYNAFGYLKRDATGKRTYVDLAAKFREQVGAREFADIWETLVTPEGVYFRGLRDVFLWNPVDGSTAYWHHEARFGLVFAHNGKTFLQFRGEGLKVRDGAGWRLYPAANALTTLVHVWVPMADGALLGVANDGRFWRVEEHAVHPAILPPGLPTAEVISRGMKLADNSVALASGDGYIYVIAADMQSQRRFKLDAGYISGIFPARDGGILAVSDLALHHIRWPTPWTVLGSQQGADGDLFGVAAWAGNRYLLTGVGVKRLRVGAAGINFEAMPWTDTAANDMVAIDDARALLAGSYHLLLVQGGRAQKVSPELVYPRKFSRSTFHPQRIFVGTENGLRVATVGSKKIELSAADPALRGVSVSSFVERRENELWVGTERHGVWRFRFNPQGEISETRRFTEADGLPTALLADAAVAALADGSLVASTRKGFFKLAAERFVPTDPDKLSLVRMPDELFSLIPTASGDLWATSATRVLQRAGANQWLLHDLRRMRVGVVGRHFVDTDGGMMFVSTNALMLNQPAETQAVGLAPKIILNAVTQTLSDGREVGLSLIPPERVQLQEGEFSLQFDFALPEIVRPGIKRYQGRLLGVEEKFSEWSAQHRYTYSSLAPRSYVLEVRAMDSQGNVSEISPFAFDVVPAWYAGIAARAVMAALLVAAVWALMSFVARHRTRRLQQDNLTLESKVALRTQELADANRRLDTIAHIDGLTGIPNRRRLDEYLPVVWKICHEQQRPLSILIIDVDHFKRFNDTQGHLAGDELLKKIAQRLQQCLRRTEDLLARYGGEEFLVMLPGADAAIARSTAETMRRGVGDSTMGATISIGICCRVPDAAATPTALIAAADAALYAAKRAGRNRVTVSNEIAEGETSSV